ncbi:MAG: caspase family protein, partial [Pirellulaceae bacterium]|nr:caspase family protein [Pirellulaceae bacterium]
MKLSRRQMLLSTTGMVVGGIWTSFGSRNVWGQDNAGRMGLALTIGVDRVDRQHYNPLPSPLPSCVNDANAMAEIARSQGFRTITLTDAKATRLEVSRHIYFASQRMRPGDIFMISFSGHGPEHAPSTEPDAEPTGRDQGWCLYDWIMIDDELYSLFQLFQPGVRILAFADSCYSGTSTKVMRYAKSLAFAPDKSPSVDRELTKGAADLTLKTLTVEHKRNLSKVMELPPDA